MRLWISLTRAKAVFIACSALFFSACFCIAQQKEEKKQLSPKEIKSLAFKILGLQSKFEETTWSHGHPDEKGQTFEKYVSKTSRGPSKYNTIYIQQIGTLTDSQAKAVDAVSDFLEVFYCSQIKKLDPIGLETIPETARRTHPNWGDKQLLSTYILDKVLLPKRPRDAIAVLGLTSSDLWPGEGWNFVFGQASLYERVGVWSVYRYGNPDSDEDSFNRFLTRTLKVALHETGHMFGIEHCTSFRCGMNGSNSLPETDGSPMAFCSECSAKIWYRTGADPVEWAASLAKLAKSHGLREESEYWNKEAELLGR